MNVLQRLYSKVSAFFLLAAVTVLPTAVMAAPPDFSAITTEFDLWVPAITTVMIALGVGMIMLLLAPMAFRFISRILYT